MEESINEKITRKIDESVENERIASFLKAILGEEFKHLDMHSWRFSTEYEKLIKRYKPKSGGESHEN
jgi:hypothetical protein